MSRTPTIHVVTFGCQMNVYDSQRILDQMRAAGYTEVSRREQADLIVFNTCSVRERPAEKVYSAVGRVRELRQTNPDLLIVVAGCVARQQGERMVKRSPDIDIVVGPDHIHELPGLVQRRKETGMPVVAVDFETELDRIFPRAATPDTPTAAAYVTIMKGCNQFCSYCIVPFVRGEEVSKPPERIFDEIRRLVDRGAREITLLGQNVNRYGKDRAGLPSFSQLLLQVASLPELRRLRFITSHPGDLPDELIEAYRAEPKLASYIHLPLQSGSDRILKAMNRGYDLRHYLERVYRLKEARPGLAVSTDLIVGFPGESEEDFQMTMDTARLLRWTAAYSFMYSPRPGTEAQPLDDDVPEQTKTRRLLELQGLLEQTMTEALEDKVGKTVDVLVERKSQRNSREQQQWTGHSDEFHIVNVDVPPGASITPGDMVRVRITKAYSHSLLGVPESEVNS